MERVLKSDAAGPSYSCYMTRDPFHFLSLISLSAACVCPHITPVSVMCLCGVWGWGGERDCGWFDAAAPGVVYMLCCLLTHSTYT